MAALPKDMDIKNLLMIRFEWFEDALMREAAGTPYEHVTRTESRILSHLHYRQMSAAELARVLGVSRQATHRAVQRLIRKGWLVAEPHPTNARVKVIHPGPAVVRHAITNLEHIEARLAKRIGRKQVEALRAMLAADWD